MLTRKIRVVAAKVLGVPLAVILLAGTVSATPAGYYCNDAGLPGCEGLAFSVYLTGVPNQIGVSVYTAGYLGVGDLFTDIGIKNFLTDPDPTGGALLDILIDGLSIGTTGWSFHDGELNNDGCTDGSNGKNLCAHADAGGIEINGSYIDWIFGFDEPENPMGDTAHIKYRYTDDTGDRLGSLGSWDLPIGACRPGTPECDEEAPPPDVPEPSTLALLGAGLGLGGLGLARKRRQRQAE